MFSDSNVIDIQEFFALKWCLCWRCQRKGLCKERGCFLSRSLSHSFSLSLFSLTFSLFFIFFPQSFSLSWSHFLLIISFMNLLSCLRMPADTNTWHTGIGLFWNVCRGSSVFYLTKCLRCILYSFLLLLITLFLLFTVHLCNENSPCGLNSYQRKLFSKFSNKCCAFPHVRMFF